MIAKKKKQHLSYRDYLAAVLKTVRYDLGNDAIVLYNSEIGLVTLQYANGIVAQQTAKMIIANRSHK